MVLGYFLSANNFLCRRKREENFTYTANEEDGAKIVVTWSLLPFAFDVNLMLNFSSDYVRYFGGKTFL